MCIGNKLIELESTSSTNEYLNELIDNKILPDGATVTAGFQTSGKGQGSNSWFSDPDKNLLLSFILYPSYLEAHEQALISKFVSLGIMNLLIRYIPDQTVKIKWPNDILADGRKIAGILIQNAISGRYIRHSVIGIGLNVNQGYFPWEIPKAISLKMLLDREVDRNEILGELFLSLNTSLRMMLGQPEKVHEDYINSLYRIDALSNYRVKGRDIQGAITGVDEFGRLELQEKDGELHNLDIKEIEYLE